MLFRSPYINVGKRAGQEGWIRTKFESDKGPTGEELPNGVVYRGTQAGYKDIPDMEMYDDKVTGSSFLVKKGADVNRPQADGATALHWAAHHNDVELAKRLLAAGAKPNATNDYGVTPLFLAGINGSAEMIDVLVTGGADANATRPSGETVLMTAVRSGNVAAVARLLKAGAKVNAVQASKGQSALHWAVADGNVSVAKALLTRDLADRAHKRGLQVFAWTYRAENVFLPSDLWRGDDPAAYGRMDEELRRARAMEVDGLFCDFPGLARQALD